jgi:hypothetical protein
VVERAHARDCFVAVARFSLPLVDDLARETRKHSVVFGEDARSGKRAGERAADGQRQILGAPLADHRIGAHGAHGDLVTGLGSCRVTSTH